MAEVRIDLQVNDDDVKAMLGRAVEALTPPSLGESVGEGADEFVDAAQRTAPVLTGRLRGSIGKTQTGFTGWRVGPDPEIPYARIQEFGGHIYPVTAQALRFEIGGRVIFARHVYIPGTHYMQRGFEEGQVAAVEAVADAIDRKINE